MQKVKFQNLSISFILLFTISLCSCQKTSDSRILEAQKLDLIQYVNPLIGTANSTTTSALKFSHGTEALAQTVPYVAPPFAMTGWTPQTRATEKKCLAPYYYKDSLFQGFRGSHWLSGSCVQDYGSLTIMPIDGEVKLETENWASRFSHEKEITTPAYYSVDLERYNIKAELTSTKRCGIMRFTWQSPSEAQIIIQPNSDERQGFIEIDTIDNEIRGYNPVHRIYQGWGEEAGFSGYFVVQFNQPIREFAAFSKEGKTPGKASLQDQNGLGAVASFDLNNSKTVIAKVGTSFTSLAAAKANLEAEIPNWGFEGVQQNLEATWQEALNRVQVTGSEENKEIFYTTLYHSLLHPRLYSDVAGTYPAFAGNKKTQTADGFDYYSDFSMWDIYRAQLPLLHLLFPEVSKDMVQSLVKKAEQGDWMPIFPCWNSYTAAMIGDHCLSVFADAYAKGIQDFDLETAYRFARKNAFEQPDNFEDYKNGMGRRALDSYMKYGYIPMQDSVKEAFHQKEQASRTLEYAYDDFALAQLANALDKTEDYQILTKRALSYQNVFDPSVGYIRGRNADGSWDSIFDAGRKNLPYITEGTPRQYSWYVPHDVDGLIEQMGGIQQFNLKLDSMFTEGYYWHGNEPGHQTVYLFNYSGKPAQTQRFVRQIMAEEYGTGPGGLSGNDDAGQMSAWYVFSAIGFYPVCPGTDEYVLGSPVFEQVKLQLKDATFVINSKNNHQDNYYIQSATLDGKVFEYNYLKHQQLLGGGILNFTMSNQPSNWGSNASARPYSMSR